MKRAAAIQVGLLTIVCLVLLISVLFWLRGRSLNAGQTYSVAFEDIDGMREGAPVQFLGIRVGFVDAVTPVIEEGTPHVQVDFTLNEAKLSIPRGSTLSIQQSGLIGEKLLEITPPQTQHSVIKTTASESELHGRPVKVQFREGLLTVGRVEGVSTLPSNSKNNETKTVDLTYRITKPGVLLTNGANSDWVIEERKGEDASFLKLTPRDELKAPSKEKRFFTIEPPLRLKEFLEIQIASAEALKTTNDKLNILLSDSTINDLQATASNVTALSAEAGTLMRSADALFVALQGDLETVVQSAHSLTEHLNTLSDSLNTLLGDETFQSDIKDTLANVRIASESANDLFTDKRIETLLTNVERSSENLKAISQMSRSALENPTVQSQLQDSLTLFNASLKELDELLNQLNSLATEDETALKTIIGDTQQTTGQLKQFSQKLNKRFLLWRLLF